MSYVGIDLGKTRSDICVLDATGSISHRLQVPTRDVPLWLHKRQPGRIVLETSTQSRVISRAARETGHDVVVLPGHVLRALGVGRRGQKTDQRDAEVLAHAAFRNPTLPQVYERSEEALKADKLIKARAFYKRSCTQLINQVKAELRAHLLDTPPSKSPVFEARVRERFAQGGVEVPIHIELALESLRHNQAMVCKLEKALEEIGRRREIQLLRSIPGVGLVTGTYLWALIDDPSRFASADQVGSYMALVPGENSTGGNVRRTGLIAGEPTGLRPLLVQCAWTFLRARPRDPLAQWATRIMERRGKKVAICALARKLAVIAWAILRSGRGYEPSRAAAPPPHDSVEEELAKALHG